MDRGIGKPYCYLLAYLSPNGERVIYVPSLSRWLEDIADRTLLTTANFELRSSFCNLLKFAGDPAMRQRNALFRN